MKCPKSESIVISFKFHIICWRSIHSQLSSLFPTTEVSTTGINGAGRRRPGFHEPTCSKHTLGSSCTRLSFSPHEIIKNPLRPKESDPHTSTEGNIFPPCLVL